MAPQPDRQTKPQVESVDLILRVSTRWRGGDRILEYRLHSPSGAVRQLSGKAHRSAPLGAPDAFRQDLVNELERLRDGVGAGETHLRRDQVRGTLADIGCWLYRRLFSESMREAYHGFRDQVRTLLVVSDEPWIPWEIVRGDRDDDDFFCMQFEMGRWLTGAGDPVVVKGIRHLVCFTADESEGQAPLDTAAECEILDAFAGKESVSCLRNPICDKLKDRLREGFDLLHFAGHGVHRESSVEDADGARRPELARIELVDRPFLVRELARDVADRLRRDRPVVVFNSCQSGRLGHALTGLGGWAQSWIEDCGASAFLAPILSVEDTAARQLATVFYRELREGSTVGEALMTARRELRRPEAEDDLAWLAYSLHGHPNLRLVRGEDFLETVSVELPVPVDPPDPPLKLPELRWRPDRSPPGALLRAEYGVVPFHFRQTEIENLEAWCRGDKSLGIRLYTGAGGMGKTRLALEICQRLRADGWQAGLVDPERPPADTWHDLSEIGGPRLLIVDYAETRRPLLVPLLREIYKTESDAPIRVLLLARAALDWWEQLKTEGDGVGDLLSGPATRWYTLQPLAFSAEDRAESYKIALTSFAEQLEKGVPGELPEDLDADHYKRALLLHMSALAAIDGVEVKGEDGILDYVLDRERRFWRKHAVERKLAPEVSTGIGRAMAAITLGGGVDDEQQAVLAMRGLAFFKDEKENVLTVVARLLRETYPGENRWIDPVMPDLLGEHLIMREMEIDSEELLDLVLGPGESLEPGDGARPENEG